MKVCFFGSYVKDSFGIPSGNGGILLRMMLEKQNVEVVECHQPMKNISSMFSSYIKLLVQHKKINYDIMLIPWRGILTLPLAKVIHRKPIIYFPAFSIYDTLVNDRKKVKKNSLKAKFIRFVDKLACKWVDRVVLESTEEINYFVNEYDLPQEKFRQLPMSGDESIFTPQPFKELQKEFVVLFFGSFIPLHGIDTIVKAAAILKKYDDMSFRICGDGQTKPEIEKLIHEKNLKNVHLQGLVSKEALLDNIKNSDVCLGIFGNTAKAQKVLTNKVFQILASKKPLITMESPAASEAGLQSNVNCILVPPSDPQRLAEAILSMKNNPEKRNQISIEGHKMYLENLSMQVVGRKLVKIIEEILQTR